MSTLSFDNVRKVLVAALIFGAFLLTSCSQDSGANAMMNSKAANTPETDAQANKVKEIFYTIPSPIEMVSLIKKAGARYDHRILNDVRNLDKYSTARRKAINLGIYGADLSYASVFNQNQESIIYLSAAKQLADDLGVSAAFDDELMERVEMNVENRDSLLHIISETFYVLDSYLKENKRSNISAQIITGGWVEGLYLAATIIERKGKEPMLVDRLIDQKFALKDLIELNKSYNKDGSLTTMITDLESLAELYSRTSEIDVVTADGDPEKVVLGGGKKLTLSDADVDEIVLLAKDIREKYVQ